MNYKHFTIEERCCLREYYVKGKSYREIARLLGRNVSSISRELRRNCTFFRDVPRYYIVVKMPNRQADTMAATIIKTLSQFPQKMVKTITCDRGSEFVKWEYIEKSLKCDIYFTEPYRAWQKGSNENSNGLLREFYPKGRNLSRVSEKTLKEKQALMNAGPRKVLGYKTPAELFENILREYCI